MHSWCWLAIGLLAAAVVVLAGLWAVERRLRKSAESGSVRPLTIGDRRRG